MRAITDRDLHAVVEHLGRSGSIVRSRIFSIAQFRKLKAAGLLAPAFVQHWHILVRPGEDVDLQRDWAAYYWEFISSYCRHRFGDEWCLSPEASLAWWAEDRSPPAHLTIRSPKANNQRLDLGPAGSLYLLRAPLRETLDRREGQMLMSREAALLGLNSEKWQERAVDCVATIGGFRDGRGLARRILATRHAPTPAEAHRVLGALRYLGKSQEADEVEAAMQQVFHLAQSPSPFDEDQPHAALDPGVAVPPAATRVRMLWLRFRAQVLAERPDWTSGPGPGPASQGDAIRAAVDDLAVLAARWSAAAPGESLDTMRTAVRWLAQDLDQVALGTPVDLLVRDRLDAWREILAPGKPGWRSSDVCFAGSRHIPMRPAALRHAMGALFECISEEPLPGVRALVAPLILQIIHPYSGANGRVARLLWHFLAASAGLPSHGFRAVDRLDYLQAIEAAAIRGDAKRWIDLATAAG